MKDYNIKFSLDCSNHSNDVHLNDISKVKFRTFNLNNVFMINKNKIKACSFISTYSPRPLQPIYFIESFFIMLIYFLYCLMVDWRLICSRSLSMSERFDFPYFVFISFFVQFRVLTILTLFYPTFMVPGIFVTVGWHVLLLDVYI